MKPNDRGQSPGLRLRSAQNANVVASACPNSRDEQGVAKSTLSQVEAGQGNPGVETIWALATALGVPFAGLIDPPEELRRVLRAGQGEATPAEGADYTATLLTRSPSGVRRDVYRIDAEPGESRISAPHAAGTIEYVIVISGAAQVGPVDDPENLRPGDFYSYPGDQPHIFTALAPGTSAVLVSQQG